MREGPIKPDLVHDGVGHGLDASRGYRGGSVGHSGASIGRAFKSVGTRVGPGRSTSTDGEISARQSDARNQRRQHTNMATKSFPSRPTLATKTATAPAVHRSLEGDGQSISTPSRVRLVQVGTVLIYSILQFLTTS